MMLKSILEQFEILPLFSIYISKYLDLSITNETIILLFILGFYGSYYLLLIDPKDNTFRIIPSKLQLVIESIYKLVICTILNNMDFKSGQRFFPLIFSVFLFILSANLIGLIPYSFTITSHIIVTFAFSLFLMIGIVIICIRKHKERFFGLFIPTGTELALAFLLGPIELISFIFKPLSLSIRLFANMMAGHTLLKVIASFAYTLMKCSGFLFILHFVPLLLLLPLFALELAVAVIQAYVFCILICIYLNEAEHLH